MLTADWELSWNYQLKYLYMNCPCGCWGILTTWQLSSKNKHPKRTRHKCFTFYGLTLDVT